MNKYNARFASLERMLPRRRQVGVIIRQYTAPGATVIVRKLRVCFSDEAPFSKADEQAMDADVRETYGARYRGEYVPHPKAIATP